MRLAHLFLTLSLFIAVACGDDDAPVDSGAPDTADADAFDATDADNEDAADADNEDAADAEVAPPIDLCAEMPPPGPFPAPDAFENHGPGGPTTSFTEDELLVNCATLDGGERDISDHHNLVTMYDGYLLMPWAPEWSGGGLTFFDISTPCAPTVRGVGTSTTMRETHSVGFSSLRGDWAVVDSMSALIATGAGGVQFWDVSDTSAPVAVRDIEFPGFFYPDAYARVTLSVFWQVPYVYAGSADNGVDIVYAADPFNARIVGSYPIEPTMRVGQVQVIGDLLIATQAEGPRTVLLDVSTPDRPMPIPGGDFLATNAEGEPLEAYFSNFARGYIFYAVKSDGGGLLIWDVRDPENPAYAGRFRSGGNGGYVFVHEDLAFVGESSVARIYDISDVTAPEPIAELNLEGDLDTVTPIGNVAVLSVDDDAIDNEGSAIAPHQRDPDRVAPVVDFTWPRPDGEVTTTSRVGLAFSELIDPKSAHAGSVRIYRAGEDPDASRVGGIVSAQEVLVNFHPFCPLTAGARYVLEVPTGGVRDFSGNALAEPFRMEFVVQ